MHYQRLFFFGILSIIISCNHDVDGLTSSEIAHIKKAEETARKVNAVLKIASVVKFASIFIPFAGPILGLAAQMVTFGVNLLNFESPEVLRLKAEFASINNHLDIFSLKFAEVKRKIEWSTIQLEFSKHEETIKILNTDRLRLSEEKNKTIFEAKKLDFIDEYENGFQLASEKLFFGMSTSSILSNNIFDAARRYTENHETNTFEFIKGSIQLLIQAYSIDVVYLQLKYNDTNATNFLIKSLEKKLLDVQNNAIATQQKIRAIWKTQMKRDVANEMKLHREDSNHKFVNHIYAYLKDKYPWRSWFALSGNEIEKDRQGVDQSSYICNGVEYFQDRHVITASTDKNARTTTFSKSWARKRFEYYLPSTMTLKDNYAERILEEITPYIRKCEPAALMTAQRTRDEYQYIAEKNRVFQHRYCIQKCNGFLCWIKQVKCFNVIMWG